MSSLCMNYSGSQCILQIGNLSEYIDIFNIFDTM